MKTMMKLFSFSLFTLLTLFTVTGCSDDDSDFDCSDWGIRLER